MSTEEVVKDLKTGEETPEKIKESRKERRLKQIKQETLNILVNEFFVERSAFKDPEGDDSAKLFVCFQDKWIKVCKNFNASKNRPFMLRQRAFAEQVDYFVNMEKKQQEKAKQENETKDFTHWFRKANVYLKKPFRSIWYEILSGFKKDAVLHLWKNYYCKNILK